MNDSSDGIGVAVIGATNNPDSLDPALRRAGRFDREICLGIPDRNERKLILEVLCRNMKMSEDISLDKVADLTPGYVGADLNALCSHAGIAAVTRFVLLCICNFCIILVGTVKIRLNNQTNFVIEQFRQVRQKLIWGVFL